MFRCPICQRSLGPTHRSPYAPICSEACRRVALHRAGYTDADIDGADRGEQEPQFQQLRATHLFCNGCNRSMPTKEKLLLMLPSGDLVGYFCSACGADLGTKTSQAGE